MKFNKLKVPDHWEHYWTRYPEGYTILEALISWVSQVGDMVDNQNNLNANVEQFRNEIDVFVERFDGRLQEEVTQTLNDWQTSGFLDVVISEALQWQLDEHIIQLEQTKTDLAQRKINVMQPPYNAKGDGVTDDYEAIMQAYADCGDFDTLFFPGVTTGYFVNGKTLNFNKQVNTEMKSPIIFESTAFIPAMVVGNPTSTVNNRRLTHELRVRRKTMTSWLNNGDIGIILLNQFSVHTKVMEVHHFTVGLKCFGNTLGFSYNQITLGDFVNNKHHVVLASRGTGGYVNENLFIGGRIANFGPQNPDDSDKTARRGVIIESEDGIYPRNNNNVFLNPSFENEGGTGVEIKHGLLNKFIGVRGEFLERAAIFSGTSSNNDIEVLYSSPFSETYLNNSDNATNSVKFARYRDVYTAQRVLADRNNLAERFSVSTGQVSIAGCSFLQAQSTGFPIKLTAPEANVSVVDDTVQATSYAVGVTLSTDDIKKFIIEVGYETDSNHWTFVRCYDDQGNILSNAQTTVKGGGRVGEYFNHSQVYSFQAFRTSDKAKHVSFEVAPEVKKVWVGVGHNSGPSKVKGFRVLTGEIGYSRVSQL